MVERDVLKVVRNAIRFADTNDHTGSQWDRLIGVTNVIDSAI